MRKLHAVLLIAAVAASPSLTRADEEAQLRKQVERLKAENDALKAQIEKLKLEVADLRQKVSPEARRTSLSDRLPKGTILRGEFVTTNRGKDNFSGKATLTILDRKDNAVKASLLATREGKSTLEAEVAGKINGSSIDLKSVSSPMPFTLSGSLQDDYLTLLFVGTPAKARVKLKVE